MENFQNDLLEYQFKMNLTQQEKEKLRREYIIHLFDLKNLLNGKHIVEQNNYSKNNETENEK